MKNKHQSKILLKSFKLKRGHLLAIVAFTLFAGILLILISRAESNIRGDVNGDSKVDLTDLSILLTNFNLNAPYDKGDLDSSGKVDLVDLSIVLTQYQKTDVRQITASLNGAVGVVYDWTTQKCEDIDRPDLPTRAFRNASNQVSLTISHIVNRRSIGSSLNNVIHNCGVILSSHKNADPAKYDDYEWIAAPYTIDGNTVYTLVHNEYHGNERPAQCPSRIYKNCWFNSISLEISTNGGQTFTHAAAPNHLIAALPYKYTPDIGTPVGYFEPSNIMKHPSDGYYYAFIKAEKYQLQKVGVCLMRTNNLADPKSWRAWDGNGFNMQFINPYTNTAEAANPAAHICSPVSYNEIEKMHGSLTWNTYLNKFLLVGFTQKNINGKNTTGAFFSTSTDLIHWSPRQLFWEALPNWAWKPGDPDPIGYATLLDPTSTSRSFDTTGQTPYLYYTRFNKSSPNPQDADLVRVPIKFTK